jgi:hypothetical protein
MLQSKAGVENKDYTAQRALLAKVEKDEISIDDLKAKPRELFEAELAALCVTSERFQPWTITATVNFKRSSPKSMTSTTRRSNA